ncbi:hypothetical protein ES708_34052 [subsurface metagenome]
MLEFETRGRYSNEESSLGIRIGNMFYGTEGYMEIEGGTWKAFRKREDEPFKTSETVVGKQTDSAYLAAPGGTEHYANFIDAIRSGNSSDLHCDIREGFYSTALPLLANIAYRLGRELKFKDDYEKFDNDPEADTMLTRRYRKPYVVPDDV